MPSPSQCGHIPPVISNDRRSLRPAPEPVAIVTAPAPETEGTLNENACGEPTWG